MKSLSWGVLSFMVVFALGVLAGYMSGHDRAYIEGYNLAVSTMKNTSCAWVVP